MADPRTVDARLLELLDVHFETYFQRFHAPIQAQVQVYTAPPARVDAVVLVLMPIKGRPTTVPLVFTGVPVAFQGGSIAGYTFPLTPGVDTVSLMPQDADLSAYVASGSVFQQPFSSRRFSLSDAIAVPNNLRAGGNPLPATAFAADGGVLRGLHYAGSSAATDFAAMAAKVLTELGVVKAAYDLHVHTETGAITTVPTVPMTAPSAVACTKLKVI